MHEDLFQCYHCEENYLSSYHDCFNCDRKYCEFCVEEVFEPLSINKSYKCTNCKNKKKESYEMCIYCTKDLEYRDFKEKDILHILCEIYNKSIDEYIDECVIFLEKNK